MEAVSKTEVESKIGASSFWLPKQLVGKLKYASGIDDFDELIEESSLMNLPTNVVVRENGWEFQMTKWFLTYRVPILKEDLTQASFEKAEEVIEKKGRSVIGRALAGGLLLGPVAAVVGGMTGLKDKEVDQTPDSFLTINVRNQGRYNVPEKTHVLAFAVEKDDLEQVQSFFETHFPGTVLTTQNH